MKKGKLFLVIVLFFCACAKEEMVEPDDYLGHYTLMSSECSPINMVFPLSQQITIETAEQESALYQVTGFTNEIIFIDESLTYNAPISPYTSFRLILLKNRIEINTEILNINSFESCQYIYTK